MGKWFDSINLNKYYEPVWWENDSQEILCKIVLLFFYEISDKTSLKAVLPPYLKFKKPGKTSKARYWRRYCQLPF